jgi:hypothetical protein
MLTLAPTDRPMPTAMLVVSARRYTWSLTAKNSCALPPDTQFATTSRPTGLTDPAELGGRGAQ